MFFAIVVTLICLKVNGQSSDEKKRKHKGSWNSESKLLSIGIGSPVFLALYPFNKNESAETSTITNIVSVYGQHLKGELAMQHWGFGISVNRSYLYFDRQYQRNNVMESYQIVEKIVNVNLRANYHILKDRIIDPYVGVGAGLRVSKHWYDGDYYPTKDKLPIGVEATIGLRCLVLGRVGIYGECGVGRTLYQGGLSFNFGAL
ncbi:MAG: hypothetical protein SGJ15_14875 [Bacteroidota bacterium]|nr:hypothetical protein [Bacteroidota bacterium]